MPDKERELSYLERFLAAVPECPSSPVDRGESPDFVVGGADSAVGIEFTTFRLPPPIGSPHPEEQLRLRWRVVMQAERLYASRQGTPLYVTIRFRERAPLQKPAVRDAAEQVCTAIMRSDAPVNFGQGTVRVNQQLLPSTVSAVTLRASIDGRDKLWHPTSSGWVRKVSPTEIISVVAAKCAKIPLYRERAASNWLVLTNDCLTSGQFLALSEEAENATYRTGFDYVYWLDYPARAQRLHTVRP